MSIIVNDPLKETMNKYCYSKLNCKEFVFGMIVPNPKRVEKKLKEWRMAK